jgi:two-component system cell cycle sensor histidine kinase/response regulator CckA
MLKSHSDNIRHIERLSSSLNVMPWGVMTVEMSPAPPMIVFGNQRAWRYLDGEAEDFIGRDFSYVMRRFGVLDDLTKYILGESTSHFDFEKKIDHDQSWFRLHFIPHQDDRKYCLVVIESTTESKMLEKQFFQTQRLESLGQLAGGVAHDFNNILSIIDGYAYMIKKAAQGNDDTLGYADRLIQAVQRGASLTGKLLTFGRHKVVRGNVVDLGELIGSQESLLRPLMDASINMTIQCEDHIHIEAQDDQICQILLNLCVNARDAMPNGGTMLIEARVEDGLAVLRVKDSGCGIDDKTKEKIFDPFFSTKEQGTGLGLSMVYGLVKDMDGTIDITSAVNEGTTFTLRFPLSDNKPNTGEHDHHQDLVGNSLQGFTVMIAEDEPDLLELVAKMLEDMGGHVLRAHNGSEALMLQENYDGRIDILLTDVVMPGVNGVKLAEVFEENRPAARIMFMSGYPDNGHMSRVALPEGAFWVPKPVNYQKLGQVLKSLVSGQGNLPPTDGSNAFGRWKTA